MNELVKVAFASGNRELNPKLADALAEIYPELPLWVVSDFPPEASDVKWVSYHQNRNFSLNFAKLRAAFRGHKIRLAGAMLVPNVPFRRMRVMALLLTNDASSAGKARSSSSTTSLIDW